jgi:hypothetical protein
LFVRARVDSLHGWDGSEESTKGLSTEALDVAQHLYRHGWTLGRHAWEIVRLSSPITPPWWIEDECSSEETHILNYLRACRLADLRETHDLIPSDEDPLDAVILTQDLRDKLKDLNQPHIPSLLSILPSLAQNYHDDIRRSLLSRLQDVGEHDDSPNVALVVVALAALHATDADADLSSCFSHVNPHVRTCAIAERLGRIAALRPEDVPQGIDMLRQDWAIRLQCEPGLMARPEIRSALRGNELLRCSLMCLALESLTDGVKERISDSELSTILEWMATDLGRHMLERGEQSQASGREAIARQYDRLWNSIEMLQGSRNPGEVAPVVQAWIATLRSLSGGMPLPVDRAYAIRVVQENPQEPVWKSMLAFVSASYEPEFDRYIFGRIMKDGRPGDADLLRECLKADHRGVTIKVMQNVFNPEWREFFNDREMRKVVLALTRDPQGQGTLQSALAYLLAIHPTDVLLYPDRSPLRRAQNGLYSDSEPRWRGIDPAVSGKLGGLRIDPKGSSLRVVVRGDEVDVPLKYPSSPTTPEAIVARLRLDDEARKLGFVFPTRFSTKVLEEIVKNRIKPEKDHRPLMVVIASQDDPNGAFMGLDPFLKEHMGKYRLMVFEAGGPADLRSKLRQATKLEGGERERAQQIVVVAHGLPPNQIRFGAGEEGTLSLDNMDEYLNPVGQPGAREDLKDGGGVTLIVCHGGLELCQALREKVFPNAGVGKIQGVEGSFSIAGGGGVFVSERGTRWHIYLQGTEEVDVEVPPGFKGSIGPIRASQNHESGANGTRTR